MNNIKLFPFCNVQITKKYFDIKNVKLIEVRLTISSINTFTHSVSHFCSNNIRNSVSRYEITI